MAKTNIKSKKIIVLILMMLALATIYVFALSSLYVLYSVAGSNESGR